MATQLEQLNKLKKFSRLETTSARFLSLFNNITEVDDRINIAVRELKKQIDETSDIREDQIIEIAKTIAIQGETGKQGKQGERGLTGKVGLQGKTGPQGIQGPVSAPGLNGLNGRDGLAGKDGLDGKDGNPVDVEKIIKRMKIDAKQITNLPKPTTIERTVVRNAPGGGSSGVERILSGDKVIRLGATELNFGDNLTVTRTPNGVRIDGGSGAPTKETPTGAVNSVNVTFTVTGEPDRVIADGVTYFAGFGYSFSSPNITMEIPPSSYIRAYV